MTKLRGFTLLLLAVLTLSTSGSSDQQADIPDALVVAIRAGNSRELARYFNANIELVIQKKEGVYSKSQAEQIVKDFFSRHVPSGFTVIHRGGKDGSRYAIGNLHTSSGVFRVYFLIKSSNNELYIHQLRIEDDN